MIYLCPERSFVKPILKDFLREKKTKGNLFFILTSAREFHHRSHLALKEASTWVVATF
jgi:hypothetical protein